MAAITESTSYNIIPGIGKKIIFVETPATADSADTIDLSSSTVTGGETLETLFWVHACDKSTGDKVTATWSGTTVTLDAAGGTTNKVYTIMAVGE